MVTATLETKRLPHATQSGPAAASLWIASQALSAGLIVVQVLLLPVAGRHFTDNGSGGPAVIPDDVFVLGGLIFVAAFIACIFLRRRINAALAMRTPGMLVEYTSREPSRHPTRLPGWIAEILKIGVGLTAAFYAATHAAGDHGFTALMLIMLGLVSLGSSVSAGVTVAVKHSPGWSIDLFTHLVSGLCWVTGLLYIGRNVAPRGDFTSPEVAPFPLLAAAVVCAICLGIKWTARAIRNSGGHEELTDFAEEAAEGVLTRYYNAAPTEDDRQRAHRIGRITLYAILVTISALMLVALLVS